MYKQINNYIDQHNLIPDNATIIVGLSGGPDSVFLLYFLKELAKQKNLKLIAAHLDHEWRDDSSKDEQFCARLAESLNIDYVHDIASNFSATEKFGGSKEEFGRRMRRKFLESLAHKYNADAIALAHHLDDQEETFFIRLLRGTSLSGLTVMKPKAGLYIRPLLETQKKDIVAWLDKKGIEYLIDPTNVSQDFLRNRIRATVIPAMRECDDRFDKNFLSTLLKLQDADRLLDELTREKFREITNPPNGSTCLSGCSPRTEEKKSAHHQTDTTQKPRKKSSPLTVRGEQEHSDVSNHTGKIAINKLLSLDPYLQKRILMHWLIVNKVPFTPQDSFFNEILRFLSQPGSKTHQIHEQWGIRKEKKMASIISISIIFQDALITKI